jgi:predicted nucleotidyltransferase
MRFVMPVRSLNSSVIKWPDLETVREAIGRWAKEEVPKHHGLIRLGYFGSYARGEWGVGSDLDLIAIVAEAADAFERRNLSWSLTSLPVPSDLLVYTLSEWESLEKTGSRFARSLSRETVWIYGTEGSMLEAGWSFSLSLSPQNLEPSTRSENYQSVAKARNLESTKKVLIF